MVDVVAGGSTTSDTAAREDHDLVIALAQEDVTFSTKEIVTGEVEISTVTHFHDVAIDEALISQHAEVERVKIGKFVDVAPEVREQDGVVIIPVIEEVAVVVRRLLLTEEIHVRLAQTTQRHQETVTLRQQEATVQRRAPAHGPSHCDTVSVNPEEIMP